MPLKCETGEIYRVQNSVVKSRCEILSGTHSQRMKSGHVLIHITTRGKKLSVDFSTCRKLLAMAACIGTTLGAFLHQRSTACFRIHVRNALHCSFSTKSSRFTLRSSWRSIRFCTSAMSSVTVAEEPTSSNQEVDALDIRVGRIVKAWKHPDADSLYVEEVDMAEDAGPRTICSGLVNYVPENELQGKYVVVLGNLKPRNMKGIKSNGMLLAASDSAHENVELIVPPEGSNVGERIWFGSEDEQATQSPPATPNQLQKKKIWECIQPKLKTGDDLVVYFEGKPMRTSAGLVSSKTLGGANVS